MNAIAKTVLYKLENESSRTRTTINQLALEIGASRRSIERAIEELRSEGFPICSDCSKKPHGVYFARTEDEAAQWFRQIYSRINKMFKSVDRVKRGFKPFEEKIQLSLFESAR